LALDRSAVDYQQRARVLAERFAPRAALWDRERRYCWENVAELAEAGLMGMTLPTEYGGRGASVYETCLVIEEIAKACTLSARIVVEANLGAVGAIMAYGTPGQKAYCAPIVLAGDKPAIAISEPEAGSAATEMTTTARRIGDKYVLNGRKHWITGGGVSKLYLIFARVLDESGAEQGIAGFLCHVDPERGIAPAGFRVLCHERTMGLCGMPEAELQFDDLTLDADFAMIPPDGADRGFAKLMSAYNAQRVGAGTVAIGVAAGALEHATRYLKARHQFGRPLAEFQGLQWKLADMDIGVHAARLMLHEAARSESADGGPFPDRTAAARAKIFAAETAIKVVDDALQIFGARGYGAQEPLERMYRDVRMFTIGGGTAEILRSHVAASRLGQPILQPREGGARATARRARD